MRAPIYFTNTTISLPISPAALQVEKIMARVALVTQTGLAL
jgi:hypothetical protein